MALLDSELDRIRFETGWNLLNVGAEPYIGVAAIFSQVIQPNLRAGAITTASTTVAAASTPTPVVVTLADPTGFAAGQRVAIDVDDSQEVVTARALTGNSLTVMLTKAHSGMSPYPITVEGGESIVRECLANIRAVRAKMATTFGEGPLKKVDEIEFYQGFKGSLFGALGDQLMFWRDELCSALGISNMWKQRQRAGSSVSLY